MSHASHKSFFSLLTGLRTLAAWGAITILSGCGGVGAPPPDGGDGQPSPKLDLNQRVGQMEDRFNQNEQNQRAGMTDITTRLAMMERQLSTMQGSMEEVRHENKRLSERVEIIATEAKAATQAVQTPQPTVPVATANEPTQETASPPPAPKTTTTTTSVPAEAATKPSTQAVATKATPPGNSKEAYDVAFHHLKQGQYDQSLSGFQNFLKTYPKDPMADNAQYWIGELHYVQRRFPEALVAFNQVLLRWPNSVKVADSLLKLGFSFYELNDYENANTSLQRLIKDYPNSSPATVAKPRLEMIKKKLGR